MTPNTMTPNAMTPNAARRTQVIQEMCREIAALEGVAEAYLEDCTPARDNVTLIVVLHTRYDAPYMRLGGVRIAANLRSLSQRVRAVLVRHGAVQARVKAPPTLGQVESKWDDRFTEGRHAHAQMEAEFYLP